MSDPAIMRLHDKELAALRAELRRREEEIETLKAKAARIDAIDEDRSGAASQDQAWIEHCRTQKWDPERHPSARAAFSHGYVAGWAMDKSFIGDDRDEMGQELSRLRKQNAALAERVREHETHHAEHHPFCTWLSSGAVKERTDRYAALTPPGGDPP